MDCSLPGSSVAGDSPGKNTELSCHFLHQRIFPTQGSNPCLLHCRLILYHRATKEALFQIWGSLKVEEEGCSVIDQWRFCKYFRALNCRRTPFGCPTCLWPPALSWRVFSLPSSSKTPWCSSNRTQGLHFSFVFILKNFEMWTIFKASFEYVPVLLLLYVLVFRLWVTWGLSFPTRDRAHSPTWKVGS